jgi:uncharacterized SAM-binding protein YcdF (DUF218 family)
LETLATKPPRRWSGACALKRMVISAAFAFVAVTFVLSIPVTGRLLFGELQIYPPLSPLMLASATDGLPTAIVILTAGRRSRALEFGSEFSNEAPDGLSLERMRYGAFLAKKTSLPVLLSGGMLLMDKVPLAKVLEDALQYDYGIQAKWIEDQSKNTAENAMRSAEMLKKAGISRVLLVTHAWHMKRAVAAFTANGLTVTPAPTAFYYPGRELPIWAMLYPSMRELQMSAYALHEIVGSVWYRLRYGY